MPRTRSRPKTEEKFQNAVLELVANKGCSALGINSIAQLAGADKVLIYRYFGDVKGLIERVAHSRQWLPTANQVIEALSKHEPLSIFQTIESTLIDHIRSDACTHQLVRWRRTNICPICKVFTEEWHQLWEILPFRLSQGLSSAQRSLWSQACALLSLIIEAELCGEPVDRQCLAGVVNSLEAPEIELITESPTQTVFEDSLPTNLL